MNLDLAVIFYLTGSIAFVVYILDVLVGL